MTEIKIACDGTTMVTLDELQPFQGELKTLSKAAFQKALNSMLELGFSYPFFIWEHKGQKNVLDGHQRLRVLRTVAGEGYKLPERFPAVKIEAKNESEAKKKLLALTSQYGQISDTSLYNFIHAANLNIAELIEILEFPQIDLSSLSVGKLSSMTELHQNSGDTDSSVSELILSGPTDNFTAQFVDGLHKYCQKHGVKVVGDDPSRPKRRYWGQWKPGEVEKPE